MDNRALRTLVRQTIRTLKVKDGDVLLIKARTDVLATRQDVQSFTNAIRRGGRPSCVVIALEDFSEITVLDEELMLLHGWVRRPKIEIVPIEKFSKVYEKDDK